MKIFKTLILSAVLLYIPVLTITAESRITATNSWTKAFAAMAGVDAEQIASSNMTHPPEYELKPSDVKKIKDADILIFAGYEVMMKTVFKSFKKPEDELVKIKTGYTPVIIDESVRKIAEKTGTIKTAEKNIEEYKKAFKTAVDDLKKKGLYGKPVIVQFHHKDLIQALGFKILAAAGPAPLEAGEIAELAKMKPALIIDNAHNPVLKPLAEISGVKKLELVNFPGFPLDDGTVCPESLKGILEYNTGLLLK